MKVVTMPRGYGKSTWCVRKSAATRSVILCMNEVTKRRLVSIASDLKLDIPEPVTISNVRTGALRGVRHGIIVDDAECVLSQLLSELGEIRGIDTLVFANTDQ